MKKKLINLAVGVALGLVGDKFLSSKSAKNLAVSAVAGGLKVKENLDKSLENIRENANDILAEAKVKKEEDDKKEREKEEALNIENLANMAEEKKNEPKEDLED